MMERYDVGPRMSEMTVYNKVAYLSGQGFEWPILSLALPVIGYSWNIAAALSGAVACLFKPFSDNALLEAVETAVRTREA